MGASTLRVDSLRTASPHPAPAEDRELRCLACGKRLFSSVAPDLLTPGLRCSLCLGELYLVPGCAGGLAAEI